ncbi:MAG: hypothetical protein Q7J44_21325 [Pseudotabrizicola sp.]|uniref:hypothetical protein n=1 Tax=Pseudotabrizicola sp. TaxID=2939647 RepID=UPI00271C2962|nr:hypothetical protein [Pseudotabrizicola sp.]MDO9641079.1 hypothetical protein [Pseudotabrizicola sp.]
MPETTAYQEAVHRMWRAGAGLAEMDSQFWSRINRLMEQTQINCSKHAARDVHASTKSQTLFFARLREVIDVSGHCSGADPETAMLWRDCAQAGQVFDQPPSSPRA